MKLDINRGMYVPDYEGDKSKFKFSIFLTRFLNLDKCQEFITTF